MDQELKAKNQRKIELMFSVMDSMEDLRDIFRRSAPLLCLEADERESAAAAVKNAIIALEELENLL